ncbi:hypothetical protein TNCV_2084301 [Trichonephila clavipes]|uniref:Uncharacterized protein n=1 Tax=Trichonephila clavipes TaxID=2585209 RepID=A0A8X6RSV0_TRICX|nr:hypothetical protein TNCV_2084301 [Trichonephila clavipes]
MFLVTGKGSRNREIRKIEFRKIEVELYCRFSFSSLHLRYWVNRNTLKKSEVARTLEKSAHPRSRGKRGCGHFG